MSCRCYWHRIIWLEIMAKKADVADIKVFSRNLPRGIEELHGNSNVPTNIWYCYGMSLIELPQELTCAIILSYFYTLCTSVKKNDALWHNLCLSAVPFSSWTVCESWKFLLNRSGKRDFGLSVRWHCLSTCRFEWKAFVGVNIGYASLQTGHSLMLCVLRTKHVCNHRSF
jgi:hypothetical protein